MFKYLIFIFLIQALVTSASMASMKDLVNSVLNFTTDKHIKLKKEIHQLKSSSKFNFKIQSLIRKLKKAFHFTAIFSLSDCMPDSYAYNGTCIYFSSILERLSWFQAEKFCSNLQLKMSLLVIQNEHHFKFIHQKLIQLSYKENETSIDDVIFLVGFKNVKSKKLSFYCYLRLRLIK